MFGVAWAGWGGSGRAGVVLDRSEVIVGQSGIWWAGLTVGLGLGLGWGRTSGCRLGVRARVGAPTALSGGFWVGPH